MKSFRHERVKCLNTRHEELYSPFEGERILVETI